MVGRQNPSRQMLMDKTCVKIAGVDKMLALSRTREDKMSILSKHLIYRIQEKGLVEKWQWRESLVERKPGLFWKRWKKNPVSFLGLIHIKIDD